MSIDQQALLSDAQDLTGQGVGSVLSQKSYDAGVPGTVPQTGAAVTRDVGRGGDVDLFLRVVKAFTSVDSTATVQFELVEADDEALATNVVSLLLTAPILVTALVAGYRPRLGPKLPFGMTKRFFGLRYTVAVEALTAGQIHASVGIHSDDAYIG